MTAAQAASRNDAGAAIDEHNDLIAAAFTVFEQGGSTFPLPSFGKDADGNPKKLVTVRPARMGQIAQVMRLFREIAQTLSQSRIAEAVKIIANVQQQKIAAGEDARDLDIAAIAQKELSVDGTQKVSIVSLFMEVAAIHLPAMAGIFSDVTEEEFAALDLDEGALLCFAIFALNYDFFSRRLLPIFLAFVKSVVAQRAQAASGNGNNG